MQSQNSRLKEFLKSPIGVGITVVLVVFLLLLISLSISHMNNLNRLRELEEIESEYDEASGEMIYHTRPTNGSGNEDEIRYVGLSGMLLEHGVTPEQYFVFQSAIENYAKENEIDLFRVSYLKDSYSLEKSYVFDFKVVLNADQVTLGVEIDASAGRKEIMSTVVRLFNEKNNEVYALKIDESNVCDFQSPCAYRPNSSD